MGSQIAEGKTISRKGRFDLLKQCAVLFAKKKSCNEPSVLAWLRIVLGAHRLGYLYCGYDDVGNVDMACIGFKVKDASNIDLDSIPEVEGGNTLFVIALASESDDKTKVLKLMKWYMNENKDVTEIAFNYRGTDEFRCHKVRR